MQVSCVWQHVIGDRKTCLPCFKQVVCISVDRKDLGERICFKPSPKGAWLELPSERGQKKVKSILLKIDSQVKEINVPSESEGTSELKLAIKLSIADLSCLGLKNKVCLEDMSEPRKHHFLSQCYLKNFSMDPKGRQIYVVDSGNQSSYIAAVKDVAQERDFNRIDIEGYDPNFIEKELSKIESGISAAIKNMMCGGAFKNDTRNYLLILIALLAIRTPRRREHFSSFHSEVAYKALEVSLATKERWEASQLKYPEDKRATYEEAKEFCKKQEFKLSVTREYSIQTEFNLVREILPYLDARNWQIIINPPEEQYMTSDNPVVLLWDNPSSIPPIYRHSPGFGMTGTTVYFPLTKHILLAGSFEKEAVTKDGTADLTTVMNSHTICYASRQVFAPSKNVTVWNEHQKSMPISGIFKSKN